jgi:YHYH protein
MDEPTSELVPTGQPPTPVPSFWSKYRWYILSLVAVLIIGGVAFWLVASTKHPEHLASSTTTSTPTPSPSPQTAANHWKTTVNPAALPLGDGKVTTSPQVGYVDSCTTSFKGGGARHAGSWINTANNTWDSETKVAVQGSVSWPSANYSQNTTPTSRVLTTNDFPQNNPTGIFPISRTDPAYQYDTNPNHIGSQSLSYTLPLNPSAAANPSCVSLGPIGILNDGVVFFNALDDGGRDAVAHETQDLCDGHPNGQEMYHYHDVPSCIRAKATGSETLVGYALDGYGIYVERDAAGNLPTDADLDACHGRTSPVMWNGQMTNIYHYDATLEYPYTVGCFHGTPIATRPPR